MANWTYDPDECFPDGRRKNALNNIDLLKWIDKYIDPDKWLTRISGGEPSLYPGIVELIPALSDRGHHGIIETNGLNYIPKTKNFKLVSAWHKANKEMPKYYDLILILKNPDDNWEEKEKYCIKNDIPHVCFPYLTYDGKNKERSAYIDHCMIIKNMTTIFASGDITGCFSGQAVEGKSIFKMSEPEIFSVKEMCPACPNIKGFEYYITQLFGDRRWS